MFPKSVFCSIAYYKWLPAVTFYPTYLSARPPLPLQEFRVLVSRLPLPIDSKRLVQIMALNMFVIERAKVGGRGAPLQEAALRLAFAMFEVLVARCNALLENFR